MDLFLLFLEKILASIEGGRPSREMDIGTRSAAGVMPSLLSTKSKSVVLVSGESDAWNELDRTVSYMEEPEEDVRLIMSDVARSPFWSACQRWDSLIAATLCSAAYIL